MAAKLLAQFKRKITALELEPSTGGCFEVTVAGDLIYSKLQTGRFPDEDAITTEIAQRLK